MRKLYRSRSNKKVAGVLGGLGNYFKIDPTIIRLLFLVIFFITAIFPLLIAYIIAAIVIPIEPASHAHKKYKRLYRSRKNKFIAGVLAGIAEFFKIDPTIVRLLFIVIMIITGFAPMIFVYIVAWIIVPEKPGKNIEIEINE
ncbi:MAG: hypothetical protein KR126chlam4_00307 [Candidatus Anoxychlamydiales bacterium]|uniref:Phage shock protein PspC N-terminal domain-containing protein n=1 Tax=marine sediment metagenome TaxID=412755 RepID=A0A0F8ZVC3_9ZZZZ|nr:hypothetical protein [Candidatus Anoxychlamydiales bacterium]HEU64924.1 PspC domain-containing protein [Chlamydiota bacterium]